MKSNDKRRNVVTEKQYDTYIREYNKSVSRLSKYGLIPQQRKPISFNEFRFEVKQRREMGGSKYITKDIVAEQTMPQTTSQEQTMLNNALVENEDGTYEFNDKIVDLLMMTDLYDKYIGKSNIKQKNKRFFTLVQMVKEIGQKLKEMGYSSAEEADLIGEAFYGS